MKDVTSGKKDFWHWLLETVSRNPTAVKGFLILIVAVVGLFYGNKFYKDTYEEKAQVLLFQAQKLNESNLNIKEPAKVDTSALETKLSQVISEFPKSKASIQSAQTLADIYIEKKETQKAIDILENNFKENYKGGLADSLMGLKLSAMLEQNKQFEKSLAILNDLAQKNKKEEILPELLIRQALCHENLGQADKAKELYQKLSTEYSSSSQGQKAQKYLKLLNENS